MIPQHINRKSALIYLVLCAMLWSLGGLLIKSVPWSPIAIAGSRSAIAALVILAFIKRPKFTWSIAQWGAAISYTATVLLFVSATKLTSAANAILLQYTAPIHVALFSTWFLKERVHKSDWFVIAAVLGGMILFFSDNLSSASVFGNWLAILSGVAFAWLALFMRKQKGESNMESIFLGNVITALVATPFMFTSSPGTDGWLILLLLGVVQLGIPYVLYSIAIKHVSAIEAILVPVVEPILNPIWVLLFFGEKPTVNAILGGIIVLTAVTLGSIYKLKSARN